MAKIKLTWQSERVSAASVLIPCTPELVETFVRYYFSGFPFVPESGGPAIVKAGTLHCSYV